MTPRVDIGREACERLAKALEEANYRVIMHSDGIAALILALRAALDAAERERDEATSRGDDWCDQAQKMRRERDAADATGYARGVRDAAGVASRKASGRFRETTVCLSDRSKKHTHIRADEAGQVATAILALLPADEWVPIPYTPGEPQPRISDGVYRGIRSDGKGGFEGLKYNKKETNDDR